MKLSPELLKKNYPLVESLLLGAGVTINTESRSYIVVNFEGLFKVPWLVKHLKLNITHNSEDEDQAWIFFQHNEAGLSINRFHIREHRIKALQELIKNEDNH